MSVLCREVDRKREELRVMVGERYRDLIEAADTIHQMRSCTRSVMASLTEMQGACSSLARVESGVVEVEDWSEVKRANTAHLGVAASVKLLTVLPEQIWSAGEAGQWSSAAQLYLLAQHLHTGLQADQGSGVSPELISAWYPVIIRQWDVLQQLYSSLLSSCHSQLAARDLTGQRALDSLVAVMLLNNSSQTEGLQKTLEVRLTGVRSLVSGCRTESAITGLSSLASYIQATVLSLETCLVNGGLARQLGSLAASQDTTLSVIPAYSLGPTGKYLPQPIQQFKPKISEAQLASLEEKVLTESMRTWLDNVVEEAGGEIRSMLQFVSTVESLKKVEEAVLEILGEGRLAWAGGVSVWDLIFRRLISARMLEIVTNQLEEMMEAAGRDVESLLAEEEEQLDFVWSENSGEIGEVWGKGKIEKVGLKMKCWGWSVRLQEISARLDSALERLRQSLESHPEILSHCSQVTSRSALKLLAEICEVERGQPVLRCRVSQALVKLTTNLGRLLADRAAQLDLQLEEKQRLLLTGWSRSLLSSLSSGLLCLSPERSLTSLPAWDQLNIAESGDSGEEVTSSINIPASPSLPLLSALLQLSSDIHSQHPTSLPPTFLASTNTGAVGSVLAHYAQLATNTLTQNFALQLLFDVHFVETMLVSRENKDAVSSTIKEIVSSLEANIDPFDLSVFSPHTEERVKRSCSRLVWGLACLVPADRLPVICSYKNLHSDNHNILTISTQSCPRFQLLALAPLPKAEDRGQVLTASSHLSTSSLTSSSSNSSKSARTDKNSTGAATFFGSMSWFGNN